MRLRDAAAASHATASAARDTSHLALVSQRESLDDFLDEASEMLAAASNVHDLCSVGDITGEFELEVADASARHDEAVAAVAISADHLRDRSRQLRRAEKMVERVDLDRARVDARGEQRMNDDLSTRRR
ncbi:MAG: hypothetical protein IPQ07_29865 [Myxococcales bacterium]|nr:hypothetical protein [Myxococcales bacterium]